MGHIQIGDRTVYENVIGEYYPRLVGYASMLHSVHDAEDLVQDVFLTLWDKRATLDFPDEARLSSWLFRTAKSRMIDWLRRKSVSASVSLDALQTSDIQWIQSNDDNIISALCRKDIVDRTVELCEELPEARRNCFKFAYQYNMSAKEISKMLDIPVRTVEGHIYQALKFLRRKMGSGDYVILIIMATHFYLHSLFS
ncbi:MAG: RNA polymerase sigma factor [Candidatus Cryptobacteroides sp.]